MLPSRTRHHSSPKHPAFPRPLCACPRWAACRFRAWWTSWCGRVALARPAGIRPRPETKNNACGAELPPDVDSPTTSGCELPVQRRAARCQLPWHLALCPFDCANKVHGQPGRWSTMYLDCRSCDPLLSAENQLGRAARNHVGRGVCPRPCNDPWHHGGVRHP